MQLRLSALYRVGIYRLLLQLTVTVHEAVYAACRVNQLGNVVYSHLVLFVFSAYLCYLCNKLVSYGTIRII